MRLLVALNENKKFESKLSEHFGHCPYFAIYDTEGKSLDIVENIIDHSDKQLTPVDQIMKYKPDMVVTLGMGERAINLFKEKGVSVKISSYRTLEEVIENMDKLEDIDNKNSCDH